MQTEQHEVSHAYNALSDLIFGARTIMEIEQAENALRQWLLDHPERQGMDDGFEVLSHKREFAEWLAENPAEAERVESARLVSSLVYHAQVLGQIAPAREALSEWQLTHPDDDRLKTEAFFLDLLEESLTGAAHEGDTVLSAQEQEKIPAHV